MNFVPLSLGLVSVAMFAGLCSIGHSLLGCSALGVYLVLSIFYLISARIVTAQPPTYNLSVFIMLAALLFRVVAWTQPPLFSDDVFRYRFEGQVQSSGLNPYLVRPSDPKGSRLKDAAWANVVAKDVRAGYGPMVERIEDWNWRLAAKLSADPFKQAHWFKLPAALFDLGCLLLLWRLAPERLQFYAWCPVVIMEFWGNGHNDAIPLFFILAAILADRRDKSWLAFCLLGFAIAAKWWPAVLLLAFTGRDWRRIGLWPLAALPVALWGFPYWGNLTENAQFMTGFVGGWRNNDSLFSLIAQCFDDPYHAKYFTFFLIGVASAVIGLVQKPITWRVMATLIVLLLLSANCHVWYLTWLAALLPMTRSYAAVAWISLVPIFHLAHLEYKVTGIWRGVLTERWYVYAPVFALLAWECFVELRGRYGLFRPG